MLDHDLLSRFTIHLKEALQKALGFALGNGRTHVEPSDLLVGLLQEHVSIAAELLTKAGVNRESAEGLLLGMPDRQARGGVVAPDLSQGSRLLLEQAVLAAREFEHRYIGTEHLLYAMLAKPDTVLKAFFASQNLNFDDLREHLKQLLVSSARFTEHEPASPTRDPLQDEHEPTGDARKMPPQGRVSRKALDVFARHLTSKETVATLDPVIGREEELARTIEILCRRTKNNPVLLGEPGVGKTAIAEGLATRLANGDVPDTLQGKRLYAIDLALMVAGTMYRGEFEARLKQLVEEVKQDPNIILFIDEIHTIVGAGSTSGSLDAANILKPALARGEIRCIGATTSAEYKKHLEPDAALDRRFQPIDVLEPSPSTTLLMLKGLQSRYEKHHHVTYASGTLERIVELATRYLTDRYFPDKAIDIMDEAAAHVAARLHSKHATTSLRALDEMLDTARQQKELAMQTNDLKEAAKVAKNEEKIQKDRKDAYEALQQAREDAKLVVDHDAILEVVARLSRIPLATIASSEATLLRELETRLSTHVFGQPQAIEAVAHLIKRSRLGLAPPNRPRASWMFVGPSGTGKTALARALALELFGKEDALIRFDMSEFSEGHSVAKLLGSPAGYVGYREQNRLADAIRKHPHSVVLFDEFEKAHPDVQHLLLQILEDGTLQDASAKALSFRHTYVILTSNAGSELVKQQTLGFGKTRSKETTLDETRVLEHLRERMRPELLNRLDRIVVFQPLTKATLTKIVERDVQALFERIKEHEQKTYSIDAALVEWLVERIEKNSLEGARAVRRIIEKELESILVATLLTPNKKTTGKLLLKKNVPVMQ